MTLAFLDLKYCDFSILFRRRDSLLTSLLWMMGFVFSYISFYHLRRHFPSLLPPSRLGWWRQLIQFHIHVLAVDTLVTVEPIESHNYISFLLSALLFPEITGAPFFPFAFFSLTVINHSQTFKQNKFSPCRQNRPAAVSNVSPWTIALEHCVPCSPVDGLCSQCLTLLSQDFPYQSFLGLPYSFSCRDPFFLKAQEGTGECLSLPCFTHGFGEGRLPVAL